MAESNFIDYVKICVRSGAGGPGAVHFRREKHVPKGGPDGGNGGRGGHIILKGSSNVWTLLHLRYKKHIIARAGGKGEGSGKSGVQGKDIILDVPIGTIAKNAENQTILFEITDENQEEILALGGRGGLGNENFKTPTNQTPRYAQPGEKGTEDWCVLELKLLADVGLVGFPNAGKSTLLSVLSEAKPKIASYPFTTLVPYLGVVRYKKNQSFVMADIPGIIEGAAKGKGLGTRFLRHIERNSILLFMIPSDSDNISQAYTILLNELKMYNPELLDKTRLLAITKSDILDDSLISELKPTLPKEISHIFISSLTNKNLEKLKEKIWSSLISEANANN